MPTTLENSIETSLRFHNNLQEDRPDRPSLAEVAESNAPHAQDIAKLKEHTEGALLASNKFAKQERLLQIENDLYSTITEYEKSYSFLASSVIANLAADEGIDVAVIAQRMTETSMPAFHAINDFFDFWNEHLDPHINRVEVVKEKFSILPDYNIRDFNRFRGMLDALFKELWSDFNRQQRSIDEAQDNFKNRKNLNPTIDYSTLEQALENRQSRLDESRALMYSMYNQAHEMMSK